MTDQVDIKLLRDRLDTLEGDEYDAAIALIKTLGLDDKLVVPKKYMPSEIKAMLPPEYYLMMSISCSICNTHEDIYYHMKHDLTLWGLVGTEIKEKPEQFKRRCEHAKGCRNCRTVLGKLSVDELIDKIFVIVDDFRRLHAILDKV